MKRVLGRPSLLWMCEAPSAETPWGSVSTAAVSAWALSAWTLQVFWMPERFLLRDCIPQPTNPKNSTEERPREGRAKEKEEGPHLQVRA